MSSHLRLNDGLTAPQLGLGVWQIPDAQVAGVVCDALQCGYRCIDTATIYRNERGVGEGIRASGLPREEVYLATKLWNDGHGYDATLTAFDRSLARLGVDYVDLYLIHWPVPGKGLYVDSWRALLRLRRDGRARSIGVSNFNPAHLVRLIDESGVRPVVNQIELHPGFQQQYLARFNATHGIVTESWSPLGQGTATRSPVIQSIADKHGRTPSQVVLRWHLDKGYMVIPKTTHLARLKENIAVFDFSLDRHDLALIESLDDPDGRLGEDPEQVA